LKSLCDKDGKMENRNAIEDVKVVKDAATVAVAVAASTFYRWLKNQLQFAKRAESFALLK